MRTLCIAVIICAPVAIMALVLSLIERRRQMKAMRRARRKR